uniref:Gamma-secretase subunit PEN-2 n=4 Tax=Cyprinus carpio TaxID=7962 RepID=A0A8C1I947_CYPCA
MAVRFCVGRWQQCCSIMILSAGYLWMDLSSVFFIGNIMNLERIPNEEKLSLCRRYYLGGFAFLPFLWLVNVLWFFREAFLKPTYTEQLQIKSYVKKSALGLIVWVAVLTTWITIFQHFRAQWGEVGDYLSFTIPLGTA